MRLYFTPHNGDMMRSRLSALITIIGWLTIAAPLLWAQDRAGDGTPGQAQGDTPTAAAETGRNDQRWVIGAGLGTHQFSTPHKAGSTGDTIEIVSLLAQQVFAEWYVLDEVGFGVRMVSFDAEVTSTATGTINGIAYSAESIIGVDIDNLLFTINWIPLGKEGYTRMGVLAGIGTSTYAVTETYDPGPDSSEATSGTAALAGVYVDWGGAGFGARGGLQVLTTSLDDIDGESVDVSGNELFLDLRWAF